VVNVNTGDVVRGVAAVAVDSIGIGEMRGEVGTKVGTAGGEGAGGGDNAGSGVRVAVTCGAVGVGARCAGGVDELESGSVAVAGIK